MLCFRDENVSTDVCGSMIGSTVVDWTKRGWLIGETGSGSLVRDGVAHW